MSNDPGPIDPEAGTGEAVELRCPSCDAKVADLPTGQELDTPLVCPNCGTTVTDGGPGDNFWTRLRHKLGLDTPDGGRRGGGKPR
ncbi:MAG: hypothetical protein GVY28_07155 [Alphaproteobacteria bacterium]|jgi:DNA-directed RNA polymerase subunit RPC12/RpoP|nr:hypothetical protein [Alphaproteobacteria bacterium]